ncbi:bifunctional UDP-N-acetylmuramoyl-L-alanyl-D-glutamate--2,6-diaminopimelate ligase MurE/UDP-N-acetylmuramoyl-tripeptide--D-alanyl-D-alanine ligase MurF [Alcaligenaceae bacterium]|nr:bifunctional UDP-N-acetylmuramoyl-L-alanyl-D-glutamate--2,6-diaminopimelate ligase MurE/UDP-N-acetylmuramoyl-tripeptide--D-alanyl-D-alanine ligase MurF [Alcaligenaceae bacterium]
MTIPKIISWLEQYAAPGANLCLDTRHLQAGDVFFAVTGRSRDGRAYIDQAIALGAVAVVAHAQDDIESDGSVKVPVLDVPDLEEKLGAIANQWYSEPSKAVAVVAVTGTNGKTTCVQWLAAALNADGVPCGTIGTLGVSLPDGSNLGGALTTPDVLTMHRSLAAIRDAGAAVVALEASSIGIEQGRLDHVHIDVAAFTNLTHDHLDYHQTLESYKQAKFALFAWPQLRTMVVNSDDAAGQELAALPTSSGVLTYSLSADSDATIRAQDLHTASYGLVFTLVTPKGEAQLLTRLVGEHNAENLLLVAGVLQSLNWTLSRIARVLATLRSVEGRLQLIEPLECGNTSAALPMVLVDYAHTPDALEHALLTLREVAQTRGGKLLCVFGCGGARDRSKRPLMGRIAAELADVVVLTDDNPRDEDPQAIIDQIVAGMPSAPLVQRDRAQAIISTIWNAGVKDVVLLAGKGHETWQEYKDHQVVFDDREWARFALGWLRGASISTDSRTIAPGQWFVALKGENFDGHAWLEQVRQAGACAAIVEQRDSGVALPQIVVGDTRSALTRISTAWRRQFALPVIGVAGSNGKTTTKEMIASILAVCHGESKRLATQGNLNNDLGVPLTVLRLSSQHRAAVIELGMNHPGEIAQLTQIALPTVGLVNNAQREHQEFMHTVDAVARENGAVITGLPVDGVAVFPGDDVYTDLWRELAGDRHVLTFGFDANSNVYADQIHVESTRTACQLHTPAGSAALSLRVPGVHNLRNALAAASCALATGASLSDIVAGLQAFNPVAGRMQPKLLVGGYQLIDDTYNANPDSVRAAIDVLASLDGKKILVLGDMGEVGENGDAMHTEVGTYAHECGVDMLLTLGTASRLAAQAHGAGAQSYDQIEELVASLQAALPAHVLVKGSRSARMERVVSALETYLVVQEEGERDAT